MRWSDTDNSSTQNNKSVFIHDVRKRTTLEMGYCAKYSTQLCLVYSLLDTTLYAVCSVLNNTVTFITNKNLHAQMLILCIITF